MSRILLLCLGLVAKCLCELEVLKDGNYWYGTRDNYSPEAKNLILNLTVNQTETSRLNENVFSDDRYKLNIGHLGVVQVAMELNLTNSATRARTQGHPNPCRIEQIHSESKTLSSMDTAVNHEYILASVPTSEGILVLYSSSQVVHYKLSFVNQTNITKEVINDDLRQLFITPQEFIDVINLYSEEYPNNEAAFVTNLSIFTLNLSNPTKPFKMLIASHGLTHPKKIQYLKGYIFALSDEGVTVFSILQSPAVKVEQYTQAIFGSRPIKTILDFEVQTKQIAPLSNNASLSNLSKLFSVETALFANLTMTELLDKDIQNPELADLLFLKTAEGLFFVDLEDLLLNKGGLGSKSLLRHAILLTDIKSIMREGNHLYLLRTSQSSQGVETSNILEYYLVESSAKQWNRVDINPLYFNRMWTSSLPLSSLSLDLNHVYGISNDVVVGYQRKITNAVAQESVLNDYRYSVVGLKKLHHLSAHFLSFSFQFKDNTEVSLVTVAGEEPIIICQTPLAFLGSFQFNLNITTVHCREKTKGGAYLGAEFLKLMCGTRVNFNYHITTGRFRAESVVPLDLKTGSALVLLYLLGSGLFVAAIVFAVLCTRKRTEYRSLVKKNLSRRDSTFGVLTAPRLTPRNNMMTEN